MIVERWVFILFGKIQNNQRVYRKSKSTVAVTLMNFHYIFLTSQAPPCHGTSSYISKNPASLDIINSMFGARGLLYVNMRK